LDIAAWLAGLGLEQYEQTFQDNAISADVLPKLSVEDLKELGISAVGDRRRLLDAIAVLRKSATTSAPMWPGGELTASEGERRQVSVLFADLAGYTSLSNELDAEVVHALLDRFFEYVDRIVEEHGGRVDKHIGDCVMGVFGAPVAHGNDAERAVRAALAIRASMARLSAEVGRAIDVHIGIAGGRVVASATGSDAHRQYTVTGDSVNLAARLADAAQPGEILISESIRQILAERLECSSPEELEVKGFAQRVQAWRLSGLMMAEFEDRPFVGRRNEMRQLGAAVAAINETGRGQAIYIRGEAGIGKTRLVEEFRRKACEAGFACHTGLVLDFGTATGRDAIRALVRSLLGLGIASEEKAARSARNAAQDAGLVGRESAVFLNDLLDLPQPTELRALYDAMDQTHRDRGRRATVSELVRQSSVRQPLMLVLEDLHWADAATLGHAAALAAAASECPAALIMTSRIEGDPLNHAWRAEAHSAPLVTIDVGPLRQEEAFAFAGSLYDADDSFARACVERSGGHPLYLEQLLRSAQATDAASIPDSIQSAVLARMDALDPKDKRAVQAASVLGQRFSLDALRAVMKDLQYACAGLMDHHLVRPEGEEFLFDHALIQEGIYASLLTGRRRELHRRAADWFADRDLVLSAEHLDRAGDPRAPRAYLAAAQTQAAAYRNERALQLADRGLSLASEQVDIYALTCMRGELLHDSGMVAEAIAAYERALEVASDDAERCHAWIGIALGKRLFDRYEAAFSLLEKAELAAKRQGIAAELARIHHLRGNLHFPLGNLDACLREHEQALAFAREAGSPELEARALGGLGDAAYARGRMITAYKHFQRCVELARSLGLGRVEVANLVMVEFALVFLGKLPEALNGARIAVETARRVGHQRAELIARNSYVFCCIEMGELAQATEQIEKNAELNRRLGARRFDAARLVYFAWVRHAQGRSNEAAALAREALAISRETGFGLFGPASLGTLAMTTNNPEERRQALSEGEGALYSGAVAHSHLFFYRSAIAAALDTGDWQSAERYATALEDFTRQEPFPWAGFLIARGRALAAFGHGRRDAALMSELDRLRAEGERMRLKLALPALEAALAAGRRHV
jgi:class 3 adenylate cyclase/tetratricopeptide (TPR) repeat protein